MKGLLLLLTAFATASGLTQSTSADKLDEYMRAQVDARNFNGNVLVAKNGNVIYQKAFGYANYTTKAPLDLSSRFVRVCNRAADRADARGASLQCTSGKKGQGGAREKRSHPASRSSVGLPMTDDFSLGLSRWNFRTGCVS